MRTILLCFIPLIMASCNGNHNHDGKYKANVFTDASLSWVRTEQIELDGDVMYYKSTSIVDNTTLSEFKIPCNQYADRVEFKNKDGITCIARFDQNGDLKFQEYTYKKITGNDTESSLTEKKSSKQLMKPERVLKSKIKEPQPKSNINESFQVGYYVENKEVNPETFTLYLMNEVYSIKTINTEDSEEQEVCSGTFRKDGR